MDSSVSIYTPTIRGIPWPKRIKARPKIQRAFDAWYRINLDGFIIQLEFIRRTDTFLHLAFQGVTRVIEVELSNGELNVHVSWNEIWWGTLSGSKHTRRAFLAAMSALNATLRPKRRFQAAKRFGRLSCLKRF